MYRRKKSQISIQLLEVFWKQSKTHEIYALYQHDFQLRITLHQSILEKQNCSYNDKENIRAQLTTQMTIQCSKTKRILT